ncbi:bifunctional sugar-1-phosphate nucleotidylyltransferase/acetyltransferase [Halobaculum sp. MBLA0147]|uniref:bifunctional sugar-1-phosphate nucleotidylyltransferase/acetyltransferase n=1 Tax=Halobaculum sp. MBLA0147 TaxID=3079934 RepID=UPI0035251420
MQTVLLAAGQGTRMRPLTDRRPKPMLPVAGEPLAAHTARAAVAAGATRLVLVVGYEAAAVREHFGDEFAGVPVTYAVQDRQRGTADAVRAAAAHLDDEPFVVLNGDALYDHASLTTLYDAGPAVGSFRVENPSAYGVLHLADDAIADDATEASADAVDADTETTVDTADETTVGADDETAVEELPRVTGVTEKPADPPSNLVNTGAYVFPAAAHEWLDVSESERGEAELTDVLARACEMTTVRAVSFERWLDVGRPWELLAANEWRLGDLDRRIDGEVHADAELRGDVVVEAGAHVDSGVVIEGPALIQSGAEVGPNAYVRGATLLGPDTKVGHAVEVKNSVLMGGATVGHLSYVGDSVLGRDVNFGAGTTVANLRHDDAAVETVVKGERVSTGRRKYGVVCGDGVKTGIQTSLNAGVVLDTDETTIPGERVLTGE